MVWEGRAGAGPDAGELCFPHTGQEKDHHLLPVTCFQLLLYQRIMKES